MAAPYGRSPAAVKWHQPAWMAAKRRRPKARAFATTEGLLTRFIASATAVRARTVIITGRHLHVPRVTRARAGSSSGHVSAARVGRQDGRPEKAREEVEAALEATRLSAAQCCARKLIAQPPRCAPHAAASVRYRRRSLAQWEEKVKQTRKHRELLVLRCRSPDGRDEPTEWAP